MTKLYSVPRFGDKGTGDVKKLQEALGILADDDFGKMTLKALQDFQKSKGLPGTGVIPANGGKTFQLLGLELVSVPEEALLSAPWLDEAKKYEGKKESDPAFDKHASSFWKLVGLPGFKTIVGSARAWCALFIVMGLSGAGYNYLSKGGAGAANQGKHYGQVIDWRQVGIPKGAIVHVNSVKCGSGSNNHVTFANGSCSPEDLKKPNASFPGFGGNQGNTAKTSWYKISSVCNVRWPDKTADGKPVALPAPVAKSNGCNGKASSEESTR